VKITLTINCDGAAFEDESGPAEAARILRLIADDLAEHAVLDEYRRKLRDINGNAVGALAIEEG
jgi:hypothetical protein